jgi:hypothetical protein
VDEPLSRREQRWQRTLIRRQNDWANYGRLNPHLHDLQVNRPDFPGPISVSVESGALHRGANWCPDMPMSANPPACSSASAG